MTYALGAEQYVAVMAGYGGGSAPVLPRARRYRHENYPRILSFVGGGRFPSRRRVEPEVRRHLRWSAALETVTRGAQRSVALFLLSRRRDG